jgi:hypothetical protein
MSQEKNKADQLFKATRNALNTASLRANQYKHVVQKKIDLGAIHKKIEQLHAELGKEVDDLYQAGQKDFIANPEIARLLEKLVSLKQAAVLLEEEIELIRNEPLNPDPAPKPEKEDSNLSQQN